MLIERLYREYVKKLTIYAVSILQNQALAQDVVQDTFHEAIKHAELLLSHDNPGGWLMATLKYKIKESERERRRHIRYFLSLNSDLLEDCFSAASSDLEYEDSDAPTAMDRIKAALTPDEFELLKRLTFDRASHLEVAKEFGITVYASQKRLQRIREKLYQVFPERKRNKKE